MASFARVLDEVDANCTKVRELRTRGLKTGLQEMEAEWKTAKDEFRQKKAVLISKETKKRMLEQVWQDKVVIDEQEEREAAAEADAKKAEVVSLKRLNRERRLQVREQAEAVEAAVSRQEADLAAARATLEAVEAERAAVAESQQREAALHARIAAAKARLDAADGELFRAQTAVERLQRRKEEVETQAGEVEVHLRREAQDCEAVGAQLATLQQQAQSRDAQQSQSSEWFEHVSSIVRSLSGLSCSSSSDSLRYEFTEPAGWALLLSFDQSSGRLCGGSLEVPEATAAAYASIGIAPPPISDLVSRARHLNSAEFLVRETAHRLGKPDAEQGRLEPPPAKKATEPPQPASSFVPASLQTQRAPEPAQTPVGPPRPPAPHAEAQETPGLLPVANLNKRLSMVPLHAAPLPPSPGLTPLGADHSVAAAASSWRAAAEAAVDQAGATAPPPPPAPLPPTAVPTPAPAPSAAPPPPPNATPSATPIGSAGYSGAGYSALPTSTPVPLSGQSAFSASSARSSVRAAADTVPRAPYAAGGLHDLLPVRKELLARTPIAQPAAQPRVAAAAPVPTPPPPAPPPAPPADTPMPPAEQLRRPVTTRDVDAEAVSALGSSRHQKRRQSRKSFARAVLHPRSPCEIAARAGVGVDSKTALHDLVGSGSGAVQFRVVDADGRVRAQLAADGSLTSASGSLLAYIERDGTVGSAALEYLGEVTPPGAANGVGYVTDGEDALVAEVDYGRAALRSAQGSTVAELRKGGEVLGHRGSHCGRLEGFSYGMLQQAAAYIALIDPDFVQGK